MGAMKELATELELNWYHADPVSRFDVWTRRMPSGALAVILADECAYLFVNGGMVTKDTLDGVLIAAGEIARQELGEMNGWAS